MTTAIEYALMAGASYISNRLEINRFSAPVDWLEVINKRTSGNPSGFEATYFVSQCSNELVISFAGTDFSQFLNNGSFLGNDFWQGNIPLITGQSINAADQLVDAVEYYLQVKASVPAGTTISLTGHSLGGALASLVGVFFGETAFTFDQVPAWLTAMPGPAFRLREALIARGHIPAELAGLDSYLLQQEANGGILGLPNVPNQNLVTNLYVNGEINRFIPAPNIGASSGVSNNSSGIFSGVSSSDLHSQALLTAFLQSGDMPASTSTDHTLGQATFKLPDLLKMIFDKNLFASDPLNKDAPVENFLERLVKHEAGVGATASAAAIPADAMVSRFTADLWKLAQGGGLTMNEGVWSAYSNLNNVSKTLTSFTMQKYYLETEQSAGYKKELFTDLGAGSNGVRFDMVDVSGVTGIPADSGVKLDLSQFKGFELYFKNYISTTGGFTSLEKQLVKSMLPALRDWYVQAGASGMNAADTLNRGAFMLGGSGTDTLTGGTKADLLVGNAGDDILNGGHGSDVLIGGAGADTYTWQAGQNSGLDTILDSDNTGYLRDDTTSPTVLTGGAQYGDNRVFRGTDASGNSHLYAFVTGDRTAGGDLLVDGAMLVKGHKPGTGNGMGLAMTAPAAATLPQITLTGTANDDDISIALTDFADDAIDAGAGQDYVFAGDGNDIILGGADSDAIDGGAGNYRIYADNFISVADAITQGNSQSFGTSGGTGLKGDALSGDTGDDTLIGGTGNDILSAGAGADLLVAGAGNDYVFGDTDWAAGTGRDWGVVNNILVGGAGGIANWGGNNADVIYAGSGDDRAWGELGNDVLFGEKGDDLLVGGDGNDVILGGDNNDTLYGDLDSIAATPGSDYLDGGAGADTIRGNEGDDIIIGGTENDTLYGGAGQDTYIYNVGDGSEQITEEIVVGEINTLSFGAGIAPDNLKLRIESTGYVLALADGATLRLMGGAAGFINAQGNYTFDAGHTDIGQLQFADGASLSWEDFLKRGLDQRGTTPGATVLGSNTGDRLSGANCTLNGGAGGDTYLYSAGDGAVHIKDALIAGDTNTLRFGAGISSSQIKLGLGSLKLDLGNGEEIHIDDFNPDDIFNTSTIQRFEFDDGSTLTSSELLARGFDLDGTAGNDTITGTNTVDRINGLGGDDTLYGGGENILNNRELRTTTRRVTPSLTRPVLPLAA